MKDSEAQLDADIRQFFEDIRYQNDTDKMRTLKNLMQKHIHLHTSERLMDSKDLNAIISKAKNNFATSNLKIHLGQGKVKVQQKDLANYCVIEATIGHLNKIDCLKRLPRFDKREDKL